MGRATEACRSPSALARCGIVVVTIPPYSSLLTSLRAIRLFRLLRLVRAGVVVGRALQAEQRLTTRSGFRFIALATVFLVVIAGAVQSTVDHKEFKTFWDGVWWAVVTVITVGYGDLYPTTVPGRIIGMLLMIVGIGFLAVLTATISKFVRQDGQGGGAQRGSCGSQEASVRGR